MYWELCTAEQLCEFYAEFNATEETVKNDVRHLMKWLEENPRLPVVKDKDWLENFFFRCKLDKTKAKKKLDYYFTCKSTMLDVFEDLNPCAPEIAFSGECACYVPMPKLTPEGYRIFIFRIFDNSLASEVSPVHIMKAVQIMMDYNLKEDKHRAVFVLVDFQNFSLSFIRVVFKVLRKLLDIETKINPMRFHRILLLNLIKIAEPVVFISKAIMPKKIANRIEIWQKPLAELSTVVSPNCLPPEYGGNLKSIGELKDEWTQYFQTSKDWLATHGKLKADLSKKTNCVSKDQKLNQSNTKQSSQELTFD